MSGRKVKPPTLSELLLGVEQAHWEAVQRGLAEEDFAAQWDLMAAEEWGEIRAIDDLQNVTEVVQ